MIRDIHDRCHRPVYRDDDGPRCYVHSRIDESEVVRGYEIKPGQFVRLDPNIEVRLRKSCRTDAEFDQRMKVLMGLYVGGQSAVEALRACIAEGVRT